MKPGDVAEIHVTVTSKIDTASTYIMLIEPHTKTYAILEGPSKMDKYIYNNSVTAGWSKTYIWKVSPDGEKTDVYAPIDVQVEFSNHEEKDMIKFRVYREAKKHILRELYSIGYTARRIVRGLQGEETHLRLCEELELPAH